jgi:hypothetical protein
VPSWPLVAATGETARTAGAQTETPTAPNPDDKLALGQNEVKQLLLLMDTDKNGKISKAEYMKFMEAKFERLDKDKSGELDVKELTQSRLHAAQPSHAAPHR